MIPIVLGWGKKGKLLGYAGIEKCPHCKNWAHFTIYEQSSNVRLYWVPVAKFNTKRFLVCSICDTAWELERDRARAMLAAGAALPEATTVTSAFKRCQQMLLSHVEDINEYPEEGMALVRGQLDKEFGPGCSDYVFPRAVSAVVDTDRPR
jgi:hypothetical protein